MFGAVSARGDPEGVAGAGGAGGNGYTTAAAAAGDGAGLRGGEELADWCCVGAGAGEVGVRAVDAEEKQIGGW